MHAVVSESTTHYDNFHYNVNLEKYVPYTIGKSVLVSIENGNNPLEKEFRLDYNCELEAGDTIGLHKTSNSEIPYAIHSARCILCVIAGDCIVNKLVFANS